MSMGRELKDFVAAMNGGMTSMARLGMLRAREQHYEDMKPVYAAKENALNAAADKARASGNFGNEQNAAGDAAAGRAGEGSTPSSGEGGGKNPNMTLEAGDLQDKNALIDKVVMGESNGNWNAVYGGAKLDLSHMTIAQVMDYQNQMKRQGLDSTAVGGPQFIQKTLRNTVAQAGLDVNKTYFTPDVQRQLAGNLIDGRGYEAFKAGKISQGQFLDNLSHEFAAMPSSTGAGSYDGYNGNHVRIALGSSITQGTAPVAPVKKQAIPTMTAGSQPPATTPAAAPAGGKLPPMPQMVSPSGQPVNPLGQPITSPAPAVVADNSDNPQAYAAGGMVQAYADGGEVDDGADSGAELDNESAQSDYEDQNDNSEILQQDPVAEGGGSDSDEGAIPTQASGSTGPASAQGAQGSSQEHAPVQPEDAAEAVHDGMNYIGHHYGLASKGAVGDEEHHGNVQRFASNEGAPSKREVEAARHAVDPDGKLTEGQRNMATLYAGWKFYNQHGDPRKAAAYAGQFLMVARAESQAAGARAQAALKAGDMPTAAKEIQKAYDSVPDGKEMQVGAVDKDGVEFKVIDQNGDVTQQGKATMDQLMYVTTGMRNGTEWYRAMSGVSTKSSTAQRMMENRRAALEDFNRTNGPDADTRSFRSTLSPEAQAKFDRLDPRDQQAQSKQYTAQHAKDLDQADQQGFAEKSANIYKAQRQLQEAIRQSNGQQTDILQSAQVALKAAQDDAMEWAQASPGRAKYVRMMGVQDVPSSTQLRQGNMYGGTSGAIPGAPGSAGTRAGTGGTAAQKVAGGIDADTAASIKSDRHEAMQPLDTMSDEDFRNGGGKAVAEKAATATVTDLADGAYRKAVQGQKGLSMGARLGGSSGSDIYAPITAAMTRQFGKDITSDDREDDRNAIVGVSTKIMQANQMSPEAAVRAVKLAADPKAQMQIDGKTGKVRFGKGMQPIYLDREGITMLAALRGSPGKKGPDQGPLPPAKLGTSTITGNATPPPKTTQPIDSGTARQAIPMGPGAQMFGRGAMDDARSKDRTGGTF